MNAATYSQRLNDLQNDGRVSWAFMLSIGFHVAVIIMAIVGLPYLKTPPEMTSNPVPIEIVDISELTTAKPPPPEPIKKEQPPPEKPKPAPKPVEKPPAPPKVEAKEPPKVIPPTPPKEEVKPAPPPKPVVPPPDAQKLEKPIEPEPEPPKEEVVEENTQEAFDSLLKNLQDSEPQQATPVVEEPVVEEEPQPQLSPLQQFSNQLMVSEVDALRYQLAQCWSIQAGARYAENLVVEVRLTVNQDRTVQNAVIQDRWRYNQDPAFRAAADSAVRAVLSPMCSPLNLPPEKYQAWKDIIVNFDPRDML